MSDTERRPASQPWPEQPAPVPAARAVSPWAVLGWVIAVVAALAGLAVLASLVVAVVGLSQYGSNK